MRRAVLFVIVVISLAGSTLAQTPRINDPCADDREAKAAAITAALAARDTVAFQTAVDSLVSVNRNVSCFTQFAAQQSLAKSLMREFENSRTDKQEGATAGGGGTTSLISRGVAPRILSVATEYGALTQSVNQTVVTIKGNLAGVPAALVQHDLFRYCDARFGSGSCIRSTTVRALRAVSFGVSFDTSRDASAVTGTSANNASSTTQQATAAVFTANGREVSQVNARVELINKRDVTSKEYQAKWKKAVKNKDELKGAADSLRKEMDTTIGDLTETDVYKKWFVSAEDKIKAAARSNADIDQIVIELLSQLVETLRANDSEFDDKLRRLRAAFQNFDFVEDQFIDEISSKPVVAVEYVNNRPTSQPSVSTYRVIGDFGISGKDNLTLNAAFGFYDKAQPTGTSNLTRRWRDYEIGLLYERKLGKFNAFGPAAIDAAMYFQDQRNPAILDVDPSKPVPGVTFVGLPEGSRKIFAEKGRIGVAQVRLVLKPDGSNARIPVAVSWSNRTELIVKPTWRAQIGLTYDFDALFAK